VRLRLPLPPNFSFDSVVRSHGWYDLPPFSYDAERLELTTGGAGPAARKFRVRDGRLEVSGPGGDARSVRAMTRRVFSLDVETSEFDAALADEPELRRALARGGGRMLRAPTLFEDAVKMLLTTNCSWAATRGMVQRLVALTEDGAFPGPDALARLSPGALRGKVRCGYRAGALSRFARRVASGRLDLSAWERREAPAIEVREAILAEHGFGPYAAEGLLRVLGRHEYLALDSWIRKQYRRFYPGPAKTADGAIARRYARYGDFKGLALWLDMTRDWHGGKEPIWP
jgi:N-glycosylase/DNA lyase